MRGGARWPKGMDAGNPAGTGRCKVVRYYDVVLYYSCSCQDLPLERIMGSLFLIGVLIYQFFLFLLSTPHPSLSPASHANNKHRSPAHRITQHQKYSRTRMNRTNVTNLPLPLPPSPHGPSVAILTGCRRSCIGICTPTCTAQDAHSEASRGPVQRRFRARRRCASGLGAGGWWEGEGGWLVQ